MNLSSCRYVTSNFGAVVSALRPLRRLETLWLNSVGLDDSQSTLLVEALEGHASIRNLHLCDNKLRTFDRLRRLLDANLLHSLDVSENSNDDATMCDFLSAVEQNTSLRDLQLNVVSSTDAVALSKVLYNNTTLQSLEFYTNQWDDDVFRVFCSAMQVNNTLTSLSVWGLYAVEAISAPLGAAIAGNQCLREIAFDCSFDNEPLFAQYLERNYTLVLIAVAFRNQQLINVDTKISKVLLFDCFCNFNSAAIN